MGTGDHLVVRGHVPRGASATVCHDRTMAAPVVSAPPERRADRRSTGEGMTLFRRLFLTYAAVVGLAVAVLVVAPITVSVPTALAELAVILAGFVVTLLVYRA